MPESIHPTPSHLAPGSGEHLWVVEDITTILVSGADTAGQFTLCDIHVSPGKGTPPHVHSRESETFYITEGELEFWVNGEIITAVKGATLHAPKGVPHNFTNRTHAPARMIMMAVPAGMDEFFRAIGDPAPDPSGPAAPVDFPRLEAGCAAYGITLLPPPQG